jgi:hypothetical protein
VTLLLDMHALLWWLADDDQLGSVRSAPRARSASASVLAARATGASCGSFSRDQSSVGRRLLVVRIGRRPHLEFLADQVAVVVVVGRADRME